MKKPSVHTGPLLTELPSYLPPPSHPSRLLQSTRLSSLHHTANSHQLYILHIICVYFSATLSIHPTISFPRCVHKSIYSLSATLFLPCKWAHQYHFSCFHMCVLIDNIYVSLTHFTLYNKLQGISYQYPVPASVHLCSRCH